MGVKIKAFGHFVPDHNVPNKELAERFDLTEEWILERTGIEERKYLLEGGTSDMIVQAALRCLCKTNITATEIDCIIVATMTPDYHCPSTASLVHKRLGATNAWGFDLMAACSGFIYSLQLAASLINSRAYKTVLVCGGDKMSSCIDTSDRKTVLILGDGAGVALLQYDAEQNDVIDTLCKLESEYGMDVNMLTGGSQTQLTADNITENKQYLRFSGKRIFEHGVTLMQNAVTELLEKNSLTFDDIDRIVPHQANKRMIEALAQGFSLPIGKFVINIEHLGNTSAATVPVAISQALETGQLKGNERVLLTSVGAGFTYAASLLKLNMN
jgi:3-oxoacyl-[acyl-carrier-protein] synthase-3